MVSQLSEFLLARVQVLLLALSGKPVEFSFVWNCEQVLLLAQGSKTVELSFVEHV